MNRSAYHRFITDNSGNAVSGATVYIYLPDTTTEQTVYTAKTGGTAYTQPLTTSSNGLLNFYVDQGVYDIKVTSGATTTTYEDIEIGVDLVNVASRENYDVDAAGTLTIGAATATKIELADTGVVTEVQGNLDALEGVDVTGNITVTGTVDGRDIASDGSTLDSHTGDATIHYTEASIDHGSISGLADDDHTQYALLAGRSGGQTIIGGTGSGDDLTLQTTSHATKGNIFFGTSGTHTFDAVNSRWGFGTASPACNLQIDNASNQVILAVGEINNSTADTTGITIAPWSDNNVYIDTKLGASGALKFRYGTGAANGTGKTWMIMNDGNIIIGSTATPAAKLHVDVANSSNAVAFRAVQRDTTNNKRAAEIANSGAGDCLLLDQDGNGVALNIDSEATTANVVSILNSTVTTANILEITESSLTTGRHARFYSNSASTAGRNLVQIHNDNSSAIAAVPLNIIQDAATQAFQINQNANSAYIDYRGTEAATATAPISTLTASGTPKLIQIELNGTKYWINAYPTAS